MDIPPAAIIILCSGVITVATTVATTMLTNYFSAENEEKKFIREELRDAKKLQDEWFSKQNEIKVAKLAEIWSDVELAHERLVDADRQSKNGDGSFPPAHKDSAARCTKKAYGIVLLNFPELRPLIYALHSATCEYEAALWFEKIEDEDAALEKWLDSKTEFADAIEKNASELRKR